MRNIEKKNAAQRAYRDERYNDPEWREKTNAKAREYYSKYMKDPETFVKRKLLRIKESAAKRDLEFDITVEDIVLVDTCPILGIPIVIGEGRCDGLATLDRVDNDKGYVKGNVRIISNKANRCKADLSIADLERMLAYARREI